MRRVVAIVLAAGRSTRMAPAHKLLEPLAGQSVLGVTLSRLGASTVDAVIVVVGHEAERVRGEAVRALGGAVTVRAERYADGLSATLAAGVAALPADAEGALVVLGDMPLVRTATIDLLLTAFRDSQLAAPIVVPVQDGRQGNPVLWHRTHLRALAELDGDRGGRPLFGDRADWIMSVDVADPAVHRDIDTPLALAEARALIDVTAR